MCERDVREIDKQLELGGFDDEVDDEEKEAEAAAAAPAMQ